MAGSSGAFNLSYPRRSNHMRPDVACGMTPCLACSEKEKNASVLVTADMDKQHLSSKRRKAEIRHGGQAILFDSVTIRRSHDLLPCCTAVPTWHGIWHGIASNPCQFL